LVVSDVRVVPAGAIPRTTSGKLARWACRKQLLSGALRVHPITSDPQSLSPAIGFTTSSCDYLRINIRSSNSNAQFQVYFKTATVAFAEGNLPLPTFRS